MDLFNRKKVKVLKESIENLTKNIEEKDEIISELDSELENFRQGIYDIQKEYLRKIKQLKKDNKLQNEIHKKVVEENSKLRKDKNELQEEIKRLNNKVNWLSDNMRAPSKEEIEAYDKGYKEVERRQKEKDKMRREGVKNDI